MKQYLNPVETGENIRRYMRKANVSIFDLQMALEIRSAGNIYKWLNGEIMPNADNLVRLAGILNVTVNDLLAIESEVE